VWLDRFFDQVDGFEVFIFEVSFSIPEVITGVIVSKRYKGKPMYGGSGDSGRVKMSGRRRGSRTGETAGKVDIDGGCFVVDNKKLLAVNESKVIELI
jgi:hypothetical protein